MMREAFPFTFLEIGIYPIETLKMKMMSSIVEPNRTLASAAKRWALGGFYLQIVTGQPDWCIPVSVIMSRWLVWVLPWISADFGQGVSSVPFESASLLPIATTTKCPSISIFYMVYKQSKQKWVPVQVFS